MRNKIIYRCLFIMGTLFLISCGSGFGDDSQNLGNGYVYRVIDFIHNKDFIIVTQKPSLQGYKIFLSSDIRFKYSMLLYNDSLVIDSNVKRFMLSKLWTDSAIHKSISKELSPDNQVRSFENLEKIADSIIKNDPYYKKIFSREVNYWIISAKENKVYGPLSDQQYLLKRKELGVPQDLELKTE